MGVRGSSKGREGVRGVSEQSACCPSFLLSAGGQKCDRSNRRTTLLMHTLSERSKGAVQCVHNRSLHLSGIPSPLSSHLSGSLAKTSAA